MSEKIKKVVIKKIDGQTLVFVDKIRAGSLRTFCCGVDFRINGKKSLFSILKVKMGSSELKYCVEKLLSIKIDGRRRNHMNFNYKTASNASLLKQYEENINS